jgi:putative phosphoesterase
MRIGVVSDSHGNLKSLEKAVNAIGNAAVIFHLGDYVEDAMAIKQWTDVPVISLLGNMDFENPNGHLLVKTQIAGKTIMACHGHKYGVKSGLGTLYSKGKEENAEIVLYGHTHVPVIKETGGIFIMNPGALAYARPGGEETYGIISIDKNQIDGEIIPLK